MPFLFVLPVFFRIHMLKVNKGFILGIDMHRKFSYVFPFCAALTLFALNATANFEAARTLMNAPAQVAEGVAHGVAMQQGGYSQPSAPAEPAIPTRPSVPNTASYTVVSQPVLPAASQTSEEKQVSHSDVVQTVPEAAPAASPIVLKMKRTHPHGEVAFESPNLTYRLIQKIESLTAQVASMLDKFETLENGISTIGKSMERLEQKMRQMQKEGSALQKEGTKQGPNIKDKTNAAPEKKEVTLPQNAQAAYQYAKELISKGMYEDAETALRLFIEKFPKDPLAQAAAYWVGETYFVRKNYQQAAKQFMEAYSKWPTGQKAHDNLLKMGISLMRLGKKEQACVTFKKLAQAGEKAVDVSTWRILQDKAKEISCKLT